MVGQDHLSKPVGIALPPAEAGQEGECPGAGPQAGGLGVEADQGTARIEVIGEAGQALGGKRQREARLENDDGSGLAALHPAA